MVLYSTPDLFLCISTRCVDSQSGFIVYIEINIRLVIKIKVVLMSCWIYDAVVDRFRVQSCCCCYCRSQVNRWRTCGVKCEQTGCFSVSGKHRWSYTVDQFRHSHEHRWCLTKWSRFWMALKGNSIDSAHHSVLWTKLLLHTVCEQSCIKPLVSAWTLINYLKWCHLACQGRDRHRDESLMKNVIDVEAFWMAACSGCLQLQASL